MLPTFSFQLTANLALDPFVLLWTKATRPLSETLKQSTAVESTACESTVVQLLSQLGVLGVYPEISAERDAATWPIGRFLARKLGRVGGERKACDSDRTSTAWWEGQGMGARKGRASTLVCADWRTQALGRQASVPRALRRRTSRISLAQGCVVSPQKTSTSRLVASGYSTIGSDSFLN